MREIKFRAWDGVRMIDGIEHMEQPLAYWQQARPLMQFTGLKDKNGVEIYEGDIVQGQSTESNVRATVEYNLGCFVCRYTDAAPDEGSITPTDLRFFLPEYTVIGNIYSNPELLDNK